MYVIDLNLTAVESAGAESALYTVAQDGCVELVYVRISTMRPWEQVTEVFASEQHVAVAFATRSQGPHNSDVYPRSTAGTMGIVWLLRARRIVT